ncbi:MAG TPA: hypothetical protein VMJ10_09940 [Kofleriaceae bacterium]|nr:hypothetical protein [Kofleriaceae bacterium]
MAKHPFTKRDEHRELTRRALIKWSVAAGAALGVSRAKVFDILEKTAGKDTAFAAATNPTTRSVHVVAGNGGLAWFTQFWPFPSIAAANNASFAWNFPGKQVLVAGTDKPLYTGPVTPWATMAATQQVTVFQCGNNETHTQQPQSVVGLNGSNIFSVASALQSASPSVIPLVTIGNVDVGTAAGAATPANVTAATGIVDLFNSAASRAGGLLSKTSDAQLYKAHYDAFTQLNRAAGTSTTKLAYTTASGAAGFLGTNLSAKLAITAADNTRYGITSTTRSNVAAIGQAFIIGAKSFAMGLTNSIVLPAMDDDPHGAFDGGDINIVPQQLTSIFNAFMADLNGMTDPVTMENLWSDTVITIHGDTHKDPITPAGWPDGTANNSNTVYVYGAGHLLSGWFGDYTSANGGTAVGFDQNGAAATYNGTNQAKYAMAAIAYAIAKRDSRAISQFANGINISGVFGRPQTM